MAKLSVKNTKIAFEILENYEGGNPYIKMIKNNVIIKKTKEASDFELNYILKNYEYQPVEINKIVKITEEFGEKKAVDWKYEHKVTKLQVVTLLGETDNHFHCNVNYSRNQVEPIMCFIPKKDLLDTLYDDKEYEKMEIDFSKYDNLTKNLPEPRFLKDHQKTGAKFLLDRKRCLLCDDQGTGKSSTMIVAAIESKVNSVLIVCPASVKYTLKRELMFYVDESEIAVIEGITDKKKSELEELLGYEVGKSKLKVTELRQLAKEKGKWDYDKKYVIMNYDILSEFYQIPESRSKANIDIAFKNSPMLQNNFELIILDEIHKLSNQTSDRYKIIKDFIKRTKPEYIWGVSGTPLTNKPINLFNILQIIESDISNDFESFVVRYCAAEQINAKGEREKWTNQYLNNKRKSCWYDLTEVEKEDLKEYINNNAKKIWLTGGSSNLEELKERIKSIYIRRMKSEMNMVGKTILTRNYSLTKLQQEKYENLWEEYQNQEGKTDEIREKAEEYKQLIEGSVFRQYLGLEMVKNTIKLTEEHLEEGEKVMIVTCYENEMIALKEHFGEKCVTFSGKSTPKQKQQAEFDFMNDHKKKVFIGQIIACGVGLTLTAATVCILNSFDFVPGNTLQVIDRIHRISSTKDVTVYIQLFTDTILEDIWNTVMKKTLIIETVIKKEIEK